MMFAALIASCSQSRTCNWVATPYGMRYRRRHAYLARPILESTGPRPAPLALRRYSRRCARPLAIARVVRPIAHRQMPKVARRLRTLPPRDDLRGPRHGMGSRQRRVRRRAEPPPWLSLRGEHGDSASGLGRASCAGWRYSLDEGIATWAREGRRHGSWLMTTSHHLIVCTSCRAAGNAKQQRSIRSGSLLFAGLAERYANWARRDSFLIMPNNCLSVCRRGVRLRLSGSGQVHLRLRRR